MGTNGFNLLPIRNENIPGAARYLSAGRGITRPEPGRDNTPYWINTEAEGRAAVRELAAQKVDIIKIWVDDRMGMYPKLTPALYGAIIDEAHKNGLRVTAHIFTLEDAKGLLRANVDAFAHSVRDRDVDDEFMALVKQHPNLVVNPNLPDRGVKTDDSWLQVSLPAADFQKLQEENKDNPRAQAAHGIQARNLAKLNAAGVKIVVGTDGNTPWAPHVEMEDMVLAGMTPIQVIVAGTKNAAEFLKIADAGTLQAGKSADFIVLDANPLDDIKNTRRISSVYLRGTALNRAPPPRGDRHCGRRDRRAKRDRRGNRERALHRPVSAAARDHERDEDRRYETQDRQAVRGGVRGDGTGDFLREPGRGHDPHDAAI